MVILSGFLCFSQSLLSLHFGDHTAASEKLVRGSLEKSDKHAGNAHLVLTARLTQFLRSHMVSLNSSTVRHDRRRDCIICNIASDPVHQGGEGWRKEEKGGWGTRGGREDVRRLIDGDRRTEIGRASCRERV